MTRQQAHDILVEYQEWSRTEFTLCDSDPAPDPSVLGAAIDVAIQALATEKKPIKEYYGQ